MGYHPRIETTNIANLSTTRSRNSELWFINNPKLENAILGYLAKFNERYKTKLYAFSIEGNHLHGVALYPEANRSHYMRDLNSCVARAVSRYVPSYPGGRLFARRYSAEFLGEASDIEDRFFYAVLQPVQDGLVDKISEYPGYNCFHDAVTGTPRTFEVIDWAGYNAAKRWGKLVSITDFMHTHTLRYERLPGYENLTQSQYCSLMYQKLEERRQLVLKNRGDKPALGRAALLKMRPGAVPVHTKTSTHTSHRPRVLCANPALRAAMLAWYFDIYYKFKDASARYLAGELHVVFPEGTYKPPQFTVGCFVPALSA